MKIKKAHPLRHIKLTVSRLVQKLSSMKRWKLALLLLVIVAGVFGFYRWVTQPTYELANAGNLLTSVPDQVSGKLKFNFFTQNYTFSYGKTPDDSSQTASGSVNISAARSIGGGIRVEDGINDISMAIKPQFGGAAGRAVDGHIIYPLSDNTGWLVYTLMATGMKEDILLHKKTANTREFKYTLELGDELEPRIEKDGSVGIYANPVLSGDVQTGTQKDAELLAKARKNGAKTMLVFRIPAPIIRETGGLSTTVSAKYTLDGSTLTLKADNLRTARYPLSIDPTIYVATAQQFMAGNNETNIDFDVDNSLIKKGSTTGARFDAWNATQGLPTSLWKQGVAVAGGYIYSAGGVHPDGTVIPFTSAGTSSWTVPAGVTSVTVKAWGAGGGGGGGSTNSDGGSGGGGGYIQSTISVTPGESLSVTVGAGGAGGAFSSGGSGNNSGDGGGGGGYSRVARGGTTLVLAAGGAGGGGGDNSSSTPGGQGGAGGGSTGETGGSSSSAGGGGGGTSGSGGSGGTGGNNSGSGGSSLQGGAGADGRSNNSTDGSASNGGSPGGGNGGIGDANANGYGAGGGGGAGYYGGGGGSGSAAGNAGGGGGGGGSSYSSGSGTTNTVGSGATPGNSGDSDRGSAGEGASGGTGTGGSSTGGTGTTGVLYISYVTSTEAISTVSWAKFDTANGDVTSTNPGSGACSGWCTSSAYDLPQARRSFSLVAYNGFLYAIGGENSTCTTGNGTGDGGYCSTVYIAKLGANGEPQLWHPTNTNKDAWTYWYRDSNLSSPRSRIKAVAYSNRMYLMGGVTSSGGTPSVINSTQIASISANGTLNSWSSSTNLPYNAYGYTTQLYNDRIYLIGGASSIGGSPLATVYYNKVNADGTLNAWTQTTSLPAARMTDGGDMGSAWGGYMYVGGGCSATNGSGYCTTVANNTYVASINADGTLDDWNTVGSLSDARTGHTVVMWRNYIYNVGGCSSQNTSTGICNSPLTDINYGEINQDGDASTVDQSVPAGTAPCNGGSPTSCDLPGTTYLGNILNASIVANGYLYVIGGCLSNTCGSTSGNVAYTAISSTGKMTAPTCSAPNNLRGNIWCVDSTNTISGGIAASSPVLFGGRLYLMGGLSGGGNKNAIYYTTLNANGSIGSWTSQNMQSGGGNLGINSVAYSFAFARANPASAGSNPGNMYLFGGCTATNNMGCTSYSQAVYKCNIGTSGALSGCTTTGQLQIGTIPGGGTGLGIMSGTVYAGYVYLIGGVNGSQQDLDTVRYARIDDSNNIVTVGTGWTESPNQMLVGRRRAAAFGYNGYIYVVGGYDATEGELADIEFIKVNTSDGSLGSATEGFNVSAVEINHRWGLSLPISNSFAYAIGGCTDGNSPTCNGGGPTDNIQTFQIYNNDSGAPAGYTTSANTYTTETNRIGASAAVLNGRLYIAGGCTGATDCSTQTGSVMWTTIDAYGNLGTWQENPGTGNADLPASRSWGQLEVAGGTLYYIGGQNSSGTASNQVYYTDSINSGTGEPHWQLSSQTLPGSRKIIGAASWNNRLYVVGGLSAGGSPTAQTSVYYSSQQNSGGDISSWSTGTSIPVARYGAGVVAYANNLYVMGGNDGTNYLSDTQFAKIDSSNGSISSWTYSKSLPIQLAQADAFAVNGYMYLIGGRTAGTTCTPRTLVAPISANTTIASGNNPTGLGEWYETNQRFTGNRYGAAAAYYNGKAYVLGGGCGSTLTYGSPVTQQSTLLTQPQVAKYSRRIDTDTNVFPTKFLLNGVDNSIGARWQTNYRSAVDSYYTTHHATFDQGTDGNAVDESVTSAYNNCYGSGSGTNKYSNNQYITPGLAMRVNIPANLTGAGACVDDIDTTETRYDRFYVRFDSYANLNANTVIYTASNSAKGGTTLAGLQIRTDGTLRLRDQSTATGAAINLPANTWHRIEAAIYNDRLYVRAYKGANVNGDVPDDSVDIALNNATYLGSPVNDLDRIAVGVITNVSPVSPNSWGMYVDDHKASNAFWPGSAFPQWGQTTNFGDVTLGTLNNFTPKDSAGSNTSYARWYNMQMSIDATQTYGYPDDVSRGPTIDDLSLYFTADPSKRLMHGRTFTGGEQQPLDTPKYDY